MRQGIPLAWLQLKKEKLRLAAAIAGITFSVVLMLVQLGFESALFASVTQLYSHLSGDLVILSPQYEFLMYPKDFSERRLYQALAVDGVDSFTSLYVAVLPWKNPQNHKEHSIFVIGVKPTERVLDLPEVNNNIAAIRRPDTALFDIGSRPEFGPVADLLRSEQPLFTEVAGRRIEIAGQFRIGASFGADGNLLTSDVNFLRLVPDRRVGIVNLGLIRLKPGYDPQRLRAQVEAALPGDVRVLTHQGFVDLEREFWSSTTPIGFVFKLGLLMGIFVGCIIVYQILYSDISDHLPEYATLKAMGYRDRDLRGCVIQEALILSVLGFIPGLLLSQLVYSIAASATLLPLQMTWTRVLLVYVLTAAMCGLSGLFALRKLKSADPADIFS
jgi:putative ABC transport system permease protein